MVNRDSLDRALNWKWPDEEPPLDVLLDWLTWAAIRRDEVSDRLMQLDDHDQAGPFDPAFWDLEDEWYGLVQTLARINQRLDKALHVVPEEHQS